MISFENTKVAFAGKSDKDLKRAYWLFKLVGSPFLVKFGKWATNVALKLRLPIDGIIKKTIFRQFCGGVSIKDSLETSNHLAENNVKTILDYSIEGKTSEVDFDKTVEEIIETIHQGANNSNIPFAVFKITGITRFKVLELANNGIDNLSPEQLEDYNKMVARVDQICKAAFDAKQPVFIDAEESWIQDTIDDVAYQMSVKYNSESAVVYNTVQLYRHDRLEFLKNEIIRARNEGWKLGVKIVRGAYMEKERDRAEDKGYPSPIQPNKEATDKDYNEAIKVCVDHIDIVSFCAGTHNEESSILLAQLIHSKGIHHDTPNIFFAQLLGMSDHISFNLANDGYMVAKYVPYGPIKEVLPYLIRRAEENTSVAGQTGRELTLITKERARRKKS